MAAPNLLKPTTISGKSATLVVTTSVQTLLNNAASSGKCLRVNSIYVTNVDGTNTAWVTVSYYPQDDVTGTAVPIASTIDVPPDSTLLLVGRDGPIYLEEDRSIGASAQADSDIVALVSYEDIS
jgi:hypothetical protein